MLDRFTRFSLAIAEIYRCWHKLAAEELAGYGLNSPHAVYLNALYENSEGLTSVRLGELCGKDKADVSRMTAILERKGLLYREGAENNRYRAVLKLSPEGMELAQHVRQRASLAVELGSSGLSQENREIFYSALELIASNLTQMSKEGLPPCHSEGKDKRE